MTNWFVKRLVYLYIFGDFMCTIIRPILLVYVALNDSVHVASYGWAVSFNLLIEVCYLLEAAI